MRAHQIMSRQVITIDPDASIDDAIRTMLDHRVSGLPVVDRAGRLVGIVSESDFIRRAELGTVSKRGRLLAFLAGADRAALAFARQHGRKVHQIMTSNPVTIALDAPLEEIATTMETRNVKRLPVLQGDRVVGIVTRSDFLPVVARLARQEPAVPESDERIRGAVIAAMENADWAPCALNVGVSDGVVSLRGTVRGKPARQAAIIAAETVAGVIRVEDHLVDRADYPPPEEDLGGGDIASLQEEPSTADDEPL
ncbi:CBS domain-containing protein [Bradyrhizobium sp.]|uniref:CBS domain-containing protein n=1 Tax=Bradyrhizobium sp. TaxID=376 RepID=UPI00238A5172|nr:CBS domain-containing protein [Bradyrhizobium sp.]MDE2376946.1 CBS domain-containing protein [Bradyrhizobium sp.]